MVDIAMPDPANYEFGDVPIPDNFFDQSMEKAMTQHSRKESQIASIQDDFQNIMDPNAAQTIATNLIGFSHQANQSNENDRNIKDTVDRVMKSHSRKVSQFASLKQELGLVFDEDEAVRIAKKTMKEMNPNNENVQQVNIQNIVDKARKEHKRKVSQFQAIKQDISQYFPDQKEATKLAAEVMKEVNPNMRSGKGEEISVESIVANAVTAHKRKISTFRAVENELGLIFDTKDVKAISKDVMKKIFAQKHAAAEIEQKRLERKAKHVRKESVKPPDLFGDDGSDSDDYMDDDAMQREKVYLNEMRQQIEDLQNELHQKDQQIENMKQEISDLVESKNNLAINSNRALQQMRGYLLLYQRSVFKTNS